MAGRKGIMGILPKPRGLPLNLSSAVASKFVRTYLICHVGPYLCPCLWPRAADDLPATLLSAPLSQPPGGRRMHHALSLQGQSRKRNSQNFL